jgi:cysteine desulfurase
MERTMSVRERIWLDSASTTPLAPEVAEAMAAWLRPGAHGNPSSVHAEGRAARRAIESTRDELSEILRIPAAQIHFTGSATEANNLALLGLLHALPASEAPHRVVASALEHDSVRRPLLAAEAARLAEVTWVRSRADGRVDLEDAERAMSAQMTLATLVHVNNETGIIQPIADWAARAREANPSVVLHCDAVQAPLRLPLDLDSADLITLSGHKIHGPTGVGVLLRRRPVLLDPLIHGGPQEGGLRAGTESVAQIVGLGVAMRLAHEQREATTSHLKDLTETFLETLRSSGAPFEINAAGAPRAPGMLSLHFPQIEGEDLVIAADLEGLALSAGSACHSGAPEPSPALQAMGLGGTRARHSVRVAFHRLQTTEEARRAAGIILRILTRAA